MRKIVVVFMVVLIVLAVSESVAFAQEYKKGDSFRFNASLFWGNTMLPFWDITGFKYDLAVVRFWVAEEDGERIRGVALFRPKWSLFLPPLPIPMSIERIKLDKMIEITQSQVQQKSTKVKTRIKF